MIEKTASHLADFSPRLQSNTRALYQYCPIPIINYPQLENELFCNIYYLRHLCDTVKFPEWPIKDPVSLAWFIPYYGLFDVIYRYMFSEWRSIRQVEINQYDIIMANHYNG